MKFEFREEHGVTIEGAKQAVPAPEQGVRRLDFDLPNKLLAQLVGLERLIFPSCMLRLRQAPGLV